MSEDFEISEEEFNDLMDHYLEIGAVEVAGVLEDGEFIYKITELAEDVAPELWHIHMSAIDDAMMDLYKKGLVEVEYDENLNAEFKVSKEGKELMESMGFVEMDGEDD